MIDRDIDSCVCIFYLGSKRHAATHESWDTWGTSRKTPTRKSRTSDVQIGTGNRYVGSAKGRRMHRGPIQDTLRGTHCKYRRCYCWWFRYLALRFIYVVFFVIFFQNYDTSESKLRREFEVYGPIKKIVVVHNIDSNKPRGYAFIEYEHERDMHCK